MSIAQLIRQEHLPADFSATVDRYYRPLAEQIAAWYQGEPLFIGINGGQGTGKSTMALFLRYLLERDHRLSTAIISIDDLYLTRAERSSLASQVHPLLVTRGVPGTHDPILGLQVVTSLMTADPERQTPIPRFAKGRDDRLAVADWPVFTGRADIVILEGWCVGARPQPLSELVEPMNDLERIEDPDGRWRHYVNDQLAGAYHGLFDRLDHLIMLRAPSMACIRHWRGDQEDKLRDKLMREGARLEDAQQIMDGPALDRFIAHYQRLTEHQWRDLPAKCDALLKLAEDHSIVDMIWREGLR